MSTLYVDTLEPNQNTAITAAAGKLLPVGHVVQVVHNNYNTQVQITTTSYTATGLQATITPKQQNSKILIQVKQHLRIQSNYDQGVGLQLKRGSTVLFQSAYNYDEYHYDGDSTNAFQTRGRKSFDYMDTHNSTSAITYQVYVAPYRTDYSSYIFAQEQTHDSQITCWEIAQ